MQGMKPRTLSNAELLKYSAMLLDSYQPLPAEWATELVRRLNYYTAGLEQHTAATIDPKQLTLPL